jgi:hypothetical protein
MIVLMSAYPAWGTIVGGLDGTQNTSSPPDFLYWNNIGYVPFGASDVGGSGIYLGNGWVLTAAHVQGGSNGGYTFVIPKLNNGADAVFTPQFASQVGLHLPSTGAGSDLTLFRLQDDPLLQTLPQIQFGVTPQVGSNVTVIGSGYNRQPGLHYWHLANPSKPDTTTWTDVTGLPSQNTAQRTGYVYATQPNFAKRWGTNTTVAVPGNGPTFVFNNTELFATSFDPGNDNEAQLAPGDSGGGVFAGNRLVGLNLYKGDDSNSDNPSLGQPSNTAVFDNASFYANLNDYVNEIVGITKLHPSIDGDANLDGVVDRADFDILYSNLGTGTTWTQGDFNLDGKVDFLDFQRLELNFGQSSFPIIETGINAAVSSVPEPGSVGMLLMAACAGLLRRRRA